MDPVEFARATDRTVEIGEKDGRALQTVIVSRHFATDAEDLWEAVTDPERLSRWFLPVTGDLRLGGRYQLEGNAGGEILVCDRPHRLSITWEYGGNVGWVEVVFEAITAEGTRLELRHRGHNPEEFWQQYGPGAVGVGWDLALVGLHHEVAGLPLVREEWETGAAAQAFVPAASAAWVDAAIAAGVPAEEARSAGAQTTAFYTGTPG